LTNLISDVWFSGIFGGCIIATVGDSGLVAAGY